MSTTKAKDIIKLIEEGQSVDFIKSSFSISSEDWYRFSSKAYDMHLKKEKKARKEIENKPHVSTTSNDEILEIIDLNKKLGDYALLLPIFTTNSELQAIKLLANQLPESENSIIKTIGRITLHPHLRALQKKGRIEKFEYFKIFSKLVDAALLSYYRTNFISCYLTLLPIIEGIIIRWMGYSEIDTKPEFEDIRKFFKNSAKRQPCPHNVLFHDVYVKACDKILNNHFYKPTTNTNSWANFNRHVASHLLNEEPFGTKENCIRLFMLLDSMTEIFLYESRMDDPRFFIKNDEIENDISLYTEIMLGNIDGTPENKMFGTSALDI